MGYQLVENLRQGEAGGFDGGGEQRVAGHARNHVDLEAAGSTAIPDHVDAAEVDHAVSAVHLERSALDLGTDGLRFLLVLRKRRQADGAMIVDEREIHAGLGVEETRLAVRDDLDRRQRMRIPAGAKNGNRKLDAVDPLLDVHGIVVRQRVEDGFAELFLRIHAVDAEGRPAMRGLHAHGIPAGNALFHQVERRGGAHVLEGVTRDVNTRRPRRDAVGLADELTILDERGMERVLVPRAMAHASR